MSSKKIENPVLKRIRVLAQKYKKDESTISSWAFKNSRKAAQLAGRDERDQGYLAKLDDLDKCLAEKYGNTQSPQQAAE